MMAAMPRAEQPNPLPLGIAGEAFVTAAAVVWVVWERGARVRAWWRRWPAPATLGTLTNDDIDRLPEPGRS